MGLKITGIRIENFRKFREPFELNLVGPSGAPLEYVVLAGPNGCGKTTILEALLIGLGHEDLVAQSRATGLLAQPRIAWGMEAGTKITLRVVDKREGNAPPRVVERTAARHTVRPPSDGDPWGNTLTVIRELKVEYFSSRRGTVLYGPVEPTAKGSRPAEIEAHRVLLFKTRLMQQIQRRYPGYAGPEPRDREWLASLNAFWREFRNDGTTLELQLVDPSNLDAGEWDLFLMKGTERLHSCDELSSGELEVLAIAMPLITSEFDGLLLIDEPELHLNTEWQFSIVRAIRKLIPKAQVVIATHAEDPWDDAFTFQRFLLVPDSDPRSTTWRDAHAHETDE